MKKNYVSASREYTTLQKAVPSPYMRRSFTLKERAVSAELSVSGLGYYRLYLNGKDITKGHLAPYTSNPDHVCYYDVYDVAEHLVPGENVIGFRLGNGLINGFGSGVWQFDTFEGRGAPRVAFELSVTTQTEEIFLDATEGVVTHPSGLLRDELRLGEWFDASREIEGWACPGFDDSGWEAAVAAEKPRGVLKKCECEPIRVIRELAPVSITPEDDGYLYDFGTNSAGVCRIRIKGERGQTVTLRHGEVLLGGRFFNGNIIYTSPGREYYADNQTVVFTCSGGEDDYTPMFCYAGFRYVLVKGITEAQATKDLLTYLVMSSDLDSIGSFECSDERINTLWRMVDNANRSNLYYFPTDCPHREKNGWTGDASLSADQMILQYDLSRSWREWLVNIRASQNARGELPGIVPTSGWGFAWGNGPTWDSVLFNLPYMLYKYRGELDAARECAHSMVRYLEYIMSRRSADGTVAVGLGDWVPVGKDAQDYDAPLALTDSVMVMDMARKAADMLGAIGNTHGAAYARGIYEDMRETVRRVLVDTENMLVAGDCQSSQSIALYYGVFDEGERERAFEHLKRQIHDKGDTFDCGFIGMHCIFHVLSEHGEDGLAFRMITHDGFPSYTDLIKQGQTAIWEHFIDRAEFPNEKSYNHHFLGDISRWFMTRLAGLNVVDSTTVRLTPSTADGALTHARAHYDLPLGRVEVEWHLDPDGDMVLSYTAPDGVTVTRG